MGSIEKQAMSNRAPSSLGCNKGLFMRFIEK